jgi:hypothetical protein
MSNAYGFAMVGMFALLMGWGLVVLEHQEKRTAIINQEQVVR